MRIKARFIWILIALLGLAACGPASKPIEGVATDILISYKREGGITGVSQEWVIYPDGRIEGPGGQEMTVAPEQVIALLATSADVSFSDLQESYVSENDCCDQYTYTITVKVGDQEHTVRTSDTAEQPEQLAILLTSIEDLISTAEPQE